MRVTEAFPARRARSRSSRPTSTRSSTATARTAIAAAAQVYFGVDDLAKLTPGPGGTAGRPAEVADDARPVPLRQAGRQGPARRPARLRRRSSAATRSWTACADGGRWTPLTPAELQAALAEPVVLAGDQPLLIRRRHFTLAGPPRARRRSSGGRDAVETGGYTVITTLDWKAQQLAEKWLTAAAIAPNLPREGRRRCSDR